MTAQEILICPRASEVQYGAGDRNCELGSVSRDTAARHDTFQGPTVWRVCTMPRSVKEVVQNFEKLSSPPKAPSTPTSPPRRKSTGPLIPQPTAGPSVAHPLLRVSPSPRFTTRTPKISPKKNVVVSSPELSPVSPLHPATKPLTTPPRLDAPVSLFRSHYDSAASLSSSGASSTTKIDHLPEPTAPRATRPPIIAHQSSSEYYAINIPDTSYPPPSMSVLESIQPIEGEQLFSRDAPVLSLPALDNYLSKIPAPEFSPIPAPQIVKNPTGKQTPPLPSPWMFPPLQELSKGKSLADLMHNKIVTPNWRNRNSIFGFVSRVWSNLSPIVSDTTSS